MKGRKPRRAAGTRTSLDVLHDWLTLTRMVDKQRGDMDALERGDQRIVRCYVRPGQDERRRQWKPGHLLVSLGELRWKGSSRRWDPIVLASGEWTTNVRTPSRDDYVYKTFRIIICDRGSEQYQLAVPRLDLDLCLTAIG